MEIGFYSHVNTKPQATQACVESVRAIYPHAPFAMACDNAYDYTTLCKEHNIQYSHYKTTLGYPSQPYGYLREGVLEWLDRMYFGVSSRLKFTDYFVMLEDDVHIVKPLTIDTSWKMAGQPFLYEGQVNTMPKELLDMIEEFSGVRPERPLYNCGGGSIFKTSVFLNNFEQVRMFFFKKISYIQQSIYPTIGWMDCFMCVFYYLCGHKLVENPYLFNNFPVKIPFDKSTITSDIQIIHNIKDYY